MTAATTQGQVARACAALASADLIRLITEIDDNGPVPPRGLARIFPDLTRRRIRHTIEQVQTLGLVSIRSGVGLGLTDAGLQLADLYDSTARWARTHNHPSSTCTFITRVRATLQLLTPVQRPVAAPPAGPVEAVEDLARLRVALDRWIDSHWSDDEPADALQDLPEAA
ncbi:regulator [Streptomyces sp. NPDC087532]|uniref:regulator n=1 Tax=unclassified Streptomyces TaxID=2593676 RepID=UPI00331CFA61